MPSLTDIAAISEWVEIRGLKFQVWGLGAADIAVLLEKFPQLRMAWIQRDVTAESWFKAVPELVPMLIAAGCHKLDDPKEIEGARALGVEDQMALLSPIWRLTMPSGITAFVERLAEMMGGAVAAPASALAAPSQAPVTKSPRRSKRS